LERQAASAADIPAIRQFFASVRRELWESRSIYIAPMAVAALFLFGFLISARHLPETLRSVSSAAELQGVIQQPYDFVAFLMMGVSALVAVIYCLDALYGERRDRSILFWKSLPVSDTTAILSKMTVPVLIVPIVAVAVTVATHLAMLVFSSVIISGSGAGAATLWSTVPLFHMWATLVVHLVAGHGLWYAPIWGWLLLVSAWARRAPFLWAVLPPFTIGVVEKVAFNTSYFATILRGLIGGPVTGRSAGMSMDAMTPYTLGHLLGSPGLWVGFATATVFLAGAIRLRRFGGPS
jgi:ABC-2 type transport system permease protein